MQAYRRDDNEIPSAHFSQIKPLFPPGTSRVKIRVISIFPGITTLLLQSKPWHSFIHPDAHTKISDVQRQTLIPSTEQSLTHPELQGNPAHLPCTCCAVTITHVNVLKLKKRQQKVIRTEIEAVESLALPFIPCYHIYISCYLLEKTYHL